MVSLIYVAFSFHSLVGKILLSSQEIHESEFSTNPKRVLILQIVNESRKDLPANAAV